MLSHDFKDTFFFVIWFGIGHYAETPRQTVNGNTVEALAEQQGLLAISRWGLLGSTKYEV